MPKIQDMLDTTPGTSATTKAAAVEVQKATAPTVPMTQDAKTLVFALACFFVLIFALKNIEGWLKKGV